MTKSAVSIGDAAALYELAPSTVRWWERQGVLSPPARDGGRRRYRERDLRRLGVAYLCRVVGRLPLDRTAVVTSGKATLSGWQRVVSEQIDLLDQEVERLRAARDYLRHLLSCESDDMAQCPVLDGELSRNTPVGRGLGGDLVAAARAAGSGERPARSRRPARDESPSDQPACDEKAARCAGCRAPVAQSPRGRPRAYCSRACQQRAYRARRDARS
ncbi:MerR family transcriptional regulator [Streptomyces sp. 71268]|uniref:MerR family transcriptional regulator n=1 Tax=Streptomyces sp. 71268 TaxID=3002640 RepID=UPI0023F85A9A|nr:MerR family transcriptional regulator [Streptomyces sp. 71268]WEV24722.1 MerR family transcriptional regulator [Streptomyces sp. 71268]